MSKYGVFPGPYSPALGLNTAVFSPNAEKYGPEKTPYLDFFHAVFRGYFGDQVCLSLNLFYHTPDKVSLEKFLSKCELMHSECQER